jgi:ribosomal protein S27E
MNYSGCLKVYCPNCQDYKVFVEHENKTLARCIDCGEIVENNILENKTVKFYDKIIEVLKDTLILGETEYTEILKKVIYNTMDCKGLTFHLPSGENKNFYRANEVDIGIEAGHMNSELFLYCFFNYLKEGKIQLQFTDKMLDKDLRYCNELKQDINNNWNDKESDVLE